MATIEDVEQTLADLIRRLQRIDPGYRSMLPSRRTIEASCDDLGIVFHAYWRNGRLSDIHEGPADRPDIRIVVDSDDLMAMANGELTFREAYVSQRVRLDASVTDLLRLRAAL